MSLGGYKFAGRFCQKGSLTDQQWALLMHKTKVAAFMAANALSRAGWDYDMTGSPDGNYHCLDAVGNNYVTVFKRTNGTDDYTWFALYTLTKFTWSGTDSGAVKLYLNIVSVDGTNHYPGYYACNFHRIGTSQISYSDSLAKTPSELINSTLCTPVGNPGGSASDISSSYYPSSSSCTLGMSQVYYGFALKNDDIVMFQGGSATSTSLCCSVASGHAFSSFVNPDDEIGIFAYNTQMLGSLTPNCYESSDRFVYSSHMHSKLCYAFNGHSGVQNSATLGAIPLAYYSSAVTDYPFQSLSVYGVYNSSTKVYGKGILKLELLSISFQSATNLVPSIYSSVANGNLLCVNNITNTGFTTYAVNGNPSNYGLSTYPALYVGWDPSNPDITQASAWTEYTDA